MNRTAFPQKLNAIGLRIESSFEELCSREAQAADPPPDTLYHYTSGEGVVGILREKNLWATNILYLNDSTELTDARDVFRTELNASLDMGRLADWISTGLVLYARSVPLDHFVVSFCEHGDLLSQWQGYGPHGSGYSLGFSSSVLMASASAKTSNVRGTCTLSKVKYKHDEKRELIQKRMGILCEFLAPVSSQLLDMTDQERDSYSFFLWQIASSLNPTFALMKNDAFEAENEWRLVRTFRRPAVPSAHRSPILVRSVKGRLAPYVEISWQLPSNQSSNELRGLDVVYCGPSPEPLLDQRAVTDLVFSYNSFNTRVLQSKVPLRA